MREGQVKMERKQRREREERLRHNTRAKCPRAGVDRTVESVSGTRQDRSWQRWTCSYLLALKQRGRESPLEGTLQSRVPIDTPLYREPCRGEGCRACQAGYASGRSHADPPMSGNAYANDLRWGAGGGRGGRWGARLNSPFSPSARSIFSRTGTHCRKRARC